MIQPPPLQIRSLRHLFRNNFEMPENMIGQILSFPQETLIEDLQTILRDAIDNFEKHEKEAQKLKYWTQLHAPIHALFFHIGMPANVKNSRHLTANIFRNVHIAGNV